MISSRPIENTRQAQPIRSGLSLFSQKIDRWRLDPSALSDEKRDIAAERMKLVYEGNRDLNLDRLNLTSLPDLLELKDVRVLHIDDNQLSVLPNGLPPNLLRLNARNNRLTQLPDVLPSTLEVLAVNGNRLRQLPDRLPVGLRELYVERNQLRHLPHHLPAKLSFLNATDNYLTQLPNTLPMTLERLIVNNNQMRRLPDNLPAILESLDAGNNQLTYLPDQLPVNLLCLQVAHNGLVRLPDNLPIALNELIVYSNRLVSLPENLPPRLQRLDIQNNQLTRLPDSLPTRLSYLNVNDNNLSCLPDTLPHSLDTLHANRNRLEYLPDNLPLGLKRCYVNDNQLGRLPTGLERLVDLDDFETQNNPISFSGSDVPFSHQSAPMASTKATSAADTKQARLQRARAANQSSLGLAGRDFDVRRVALAQQTKLSTVLSRTVPALQQQTKVVVETADTYLCAVVGGAVNSVVYRSLDSNSTSLGNSSRQMDSMHSEVSARRGFDGFRSMPALGGASLSTAQFVEPAALTWPSASSSHSSRALLNLPSSSYVRGALMDSSHKANSSN